MGGTGTTGGTGGTSASGGAAGESTGGTAGFPVASNYIHVDFHDGDDTADGLTPASPRKTASSRATARLSSMFAGRRRASCSAAGCWAS